MSSKIIIDNRTSRPIQDVLSYVAAVLLMGRVSDKNGFCAHSQWSDGVHVSAIVNEKSDRLVVWEEADGNATL